MSFFKSCFLGLALFFINQASGMQPQTIFAQIHLREALISGQLDDALFIARSNPQINPFLKNHDGQNLFGLIKQCKKMFRIIIAQLESDQANVLKIYVTEGRTRNIRPSKLKLFNDDPFSLEFEFDHVVYNAPHPTVYQLMLPTNTPAPFVFYNIEAYPLALLLLEQIFGQPENRK